MDTAIVEQVTIDAESSVVTEESGPAWDHARLAPDPWIAKGLLRVTKVVAWHILLGGEHSD